MSVKRFVVTILALIYLTITSGVLINVHFCMGEIASVEYGQDATSACEKCGMESKAGCCSTEVAFVKVSEQQKSEATTSINTPLPQILHTEYSQQLAVSTLPIAGKSHQAHVSPRYQTESLNVLYRNFRI